VTVKYKLPLWLIASVLLCSVASAVVTYYVISYTTKPLDFTPLSSGIQLQLFTPWNWNTLASPYYVWVNVTNAGSSAIVINSVRIDNQPANMTVVWTSFIPSGNTIPRGEKACIQISRTTPFTAGTAYTFTIITGDNKEFAITGVAQGS
jgi:hypothetical protein